MAMSFPGMMRTVILQEGVEQYNERFKTYGEVFVCIEYRVTRLGKNRENLETAGNFAAPKCTGKTQGNRWQGIFLAKK